MMLRTHRHGFSLIEMAILLVIIGLIVATVLPLLYRNLQKDLMREGVKAVATVREEVLGYTMTHCALPDYEANATAAGHVLGRLQVQLRYRPAPELTADGLDSGGYDSLNDAIRELRDTNGAIPVNLYDDPDTAYAAFVVAAAGDNRRWDGTDNYLPADTGPVDVERLSDDFDDVVDYVTIGDLLRYTQHCEAQAGGGDDDQDDEEPSGASEYVLNTAGDMQIPNDAVITGNVASQQKITVSDRVVVTGHIVAEDDVVVGHDATVTREICSGKKVTLQDRAQVLNTIDAQSDVTLQADSVAAGTIRSNASVTLRDRAEVRGHVHAAGGVSEDSGALVHEHIIAGQNVTISGGTAGANVYAGQSISVRQSGRVAGDAYAGANVTTNTNGLVIGVINQNVPADELVQPTPPQVCVQPPTPRQTDFDHGSRVPDDPCGVPLDPGAYGDIEITTNNCALELQTGDYYLKSLDADRSSGLTLYLDLSAGPINLFVTETVRLGNDMSVRITTDTGIDAPLAIADRELAAQVYAETHGQWVFKDRSQWFGTIYAADKLVFGHDNEVIGSFYSDTKVDFGDRFNVIFVESDYARTHW